MELIPMLYSVCGVSQKIAAIRAAESSLGIQVSDQVEHARGLLVFAETARELSLRLFSDWLTDVSNIKVKIIKWFTDVSHTYSWALCIDPQQSGQIDLEECAKDLESILSVLAIKTITDGKRMSAFLEEGSAGLTSEVRGLFASEIDLLSGEPHAGIDFTDASTQAAISAALKTDEAYRFCAQPDLNDQCYENSLYTLICNDNSLNKKDYCCNLNDLSFRFFVLMNALCSIPKCIRVEPQRSLIKTSQKGTGIVKAARGALLHQLQLEDQPTSECIVKDYKIVAPTEWNFHPRGTLVKMLEGAKVGKEQLLVLVESLIKLIDPCVKWQLKLEIDHA
ncbi:MAG: nickel-dependent hydrogenase large subunit [Neptuniibacter sp.]